MAAGGLEMARLEGKSTTSLGQLVMLSDRPGCETGLGLRSRT